MGKLINKETGQRELVDDDAAAIASGKYEIPSAIAVERHGQESYAAPDQLAQEKAFMPEIDPARAAAAAGHKIRADENSGIIGSAKAVVGGAVSGATAGILDPFEDAREFHPLLGGASELAGALLPGLFGDEAGVAGAIAKDGVAAERATAGLSSKFLYGGEVGRDVGTTGRAVERGLAGAGRELDAAKAAGDVADLSTLDAKGLREARDAELERLAGEQATGRAAQRSSVVDDMLAYRKTVKDANPWLIIDEGEDASRLNKANKAIRNALDDEKGLRESPGLLAKPLRIEEKALQNAIDNREAIAAKLDAVNAKLASGIRDDLAAGESMGIAAGDIELTGKAARRYATYADVKLGKDGVITVGRDAAQGFADALEGGEVTGASQRSLGRLEELLAQNRALQTKIGQAMTPLTPKAELVSDRLKAIADAKDALTAPKTKSLVEDMLGGTIMGHVAGKLSGLPIIGPAIGAKVGRAVSDVVFGRMGKGLAESGKRTAAAVSSFLDVTKRAAPTLGIAATRILSNVAYGPSDSAKVKGKDLASLYKARSSELKNLVQYDQGGNVVMRPEARDAMAKKLAPIRAVAPEAADRMETIAARKVEFLAGKLLKRPDYGGVQTGPDNWHPADMEMRRFARYAHAVEDPHGVEERLASGQVSPEDAEAYKAVYPERFEALKTEIIAKLPLLQKTLPYERRLALSIFTGIAVDPSLHPVVLAQLQANFAGEDGSEGGTQAPTPQPQFGSVRADIGTASQQREARMQ